VEPIPTWARVAAVIVAIATALLLVPIVALSALSLAATIGQIEHITSFDVGPAPRLQVDARFGPVAIEAGGDGRIVVKDHRSAGSITRSSAAAAVQEMAVDVSRQGDVVTVRQASPLLMAPTINRDSLITIDVPARIDVDVSNVGNLRIQGLDGTFHLHGSGSIELRDTTLRGGSTLDGQFGDIELTNVTVAGSTAVTMGIGEVKFDGQLAPGGSSLDIDDSGGSVTVVLPRPTDARAVVTTRAGELRANGGWLFAPEQVIPPRRWTADLGPNPTGSVTVRTSLGGVTFDAR
jgi:hypothetical protein